MLPRQISKNELLCYWDMTNLSPPRCPCWSVPSRKHMRHPHLLWEERVSGAARRGRLGRQSAWPWGMS